MLILRPCFLSRNQAADDEYMQTRSLGHRRTITAGNTGGYSPSVTQATRLADSANM